MAEQENYKIDSFNDLSDIFEKSLPWSEMIGEKEHHWEVPLVYRGMSNVEWPLKPTIGRLKDYAFVLEEQMLTLFKTGARPYLNREPENDWDWISLAQHHGLPTRMMDWTRNPLVATYFAVEEESDFDSVVYVLPAPKIISVHKFDPLRYEGAEVVFLPEHVTQRIVAQQGQFTIHNKPDQPFEGWLRKIIILAKARKKIRYKLAHFGVDRSSLFPDLDGLAANIKWIKTEDRLDLPGITSE